MSEYESIFTDESDDKFSRYGDDEDEVDLFEQEEKDEFFLQLEESELERELEDDLDDDDDF